MENIKDIVLLLTVLHLVYAVLFRSKPFLLFLYYLRRNVIKTTFKENGFVLGIKDYKRKTNKEW